MENGLKLQEKEREKTKSVPTHNEFSESVFGHIDKLLREKPNISTISEEAYIMFIHNKTRDWILRKKVKCYLRREKKYEKLTIYLRKGVMKLKEREINC